MSDRMVYLIIVFCSFFSVGNHALSASGEILITKNYQISDDESFTEVSRSLRGFFAMRYFHKDRKFAPTLSVDKDKNSFSVTALAKYHEGVQIYTNCLKKENKGYDFINSENLVDRLKGLPDDENMFTLAYVMSEEVEGLGSRGILHKINVKKAEMKMIRVGQYIPFLKFSTKYKVILFTAVREDHFLISEILFSSKGE